MIFVSIQDKEKENGQPNENKSLLYLSTEPNLMNSLNTFEDDFLLS